jgi:hypothetical protein
MGMVAALNRFRVELLGRKNHQPEQEESTNMSKHNRERRKRKPKYLEAVTAAGLEALANGTIRPGDLHVVDIFHDRWCDLLAGKGPCNCNPEVGRPRAIIDPGRN